MIKIAHRGNTKGRNKALENDPSYINSATSKGHHCEVDVWFIKGDFWLGHDAPTYPTDIDFLENDKLICHAKNIEALHEMLKSSNIHCFWHEQD